MTVVVVGGGVAGLTAARRLAIAGRPVILLERSPQLGGRVGRHDMGGIALDSGAESFAVRGGVVAALLVELGLAESVVEPIPGGAWVALDDRTVPLPAGGVLGIPSSPLADDVRRAIGSRASIRAYLDRLAPVLRVGRYDRLGALVRARMGDAVLERLVAPVVESVYGANPDDVSIDAIAPGLNASITASGSLSLAVQRMRAAAPAGSAVQSIDGGLYRLPEALAADAMTRGVDVRAGVAVSAVLPGVVDGLWTVMTDGGAIDATGVVIAADGAAAFALLTAAIPPLGSLPHPVPAVSRIVTLTVDDARLDARPRGSGVLRAAAREGIQATAITHLTGKWDWIRRDLPPGRHVLRLSYRGEDAVSDAVARADASALLGIDLPDSIDRADVLWTDSAPPLATETLALRRATDAALTILPGLAVTGSWRTGTGLASVIAGAERAASSLLGP